MSLQKPLSELFRPMSPEELILDDEVIRRFEAMLEHKTPVNMLFYGPPGSGKTSAARMFLEARGQLGVLRVDGSLHWNRLCPQPDRGLCLNCGF